MLEVFGRFARDILGEIWPAYLLLAILPIAGFTRGIEAGLRALGLVAISQVGPLLTIAFSALVYRESAATGGVAAVHAAIVVGGLLLIGVMWRRLRKDLPLWAALPFFTGIAIITWMTVLVTDMLLTHDSL